MKRGQLQKMVSIRDLLRKLRTHSVMAIGASVALVTVVCGSIAVNVLGAIETDALAIQTDTRNLADRVGEETRMLEAKAEEMRVQMDHIEETLAVMESAINSAQEASGTIERILGETGSVNAQLKDAFSQIVTQMDTVSGYITESRTCLASLEVKINGIQRGELPAPETLDAMLEEVRSSVMIVIEQFTLLSADVSAITEELRVCGVHVKPFTGAVKTLEDIFRAGLKDLKASLESLADDHLELGDNTAVMLARLKLSMKSIDALTEKVDISNDIIAGLNERIDMSNRVIAELRAEVTASGALVAALGEQLTGMTGDIQSMYDMQREATERMVADQLGALERAAAAQQDTLEQAVREQAKTLEESGINNLVRGEGYVTVSFSFSEGANSGSLSFNLANHLQNYGNISSADILVRDFNVRTTGSSQGHGGVSASIRMASASYDPVTGKLVIPHNFLESPFGGQQGSVTFAIVGGVLKEKE